MPAPSSAPEPRLLRSLGHPVRWELLRALSAGDRTVNELTSLVGEPQNLVSYHLGRLRRDRLVTSRRSSADRRDSYYRVELGRLQEALGETGGALHPALRLVPPHAAFPEVEVVAEVLFLCTGNSARSQMAEALLRERSRGRVAAHSAGSHPKPMHPNAVRVMREDFGIELRGQTPKHLDVFAEARLDRVITLCDRVREVCPELPGAATTVHWSMADPAAEGAADDPASSYPAFRETAAELHDRIRFLLIDVLSTGFGPPTTKG